jgi:VWFA-related protein
MSALHRIRVALILSSCSALFLFAQQSATPPQDTTQPAAAPSPSRQEPVLVQRPPPKPASPVSPVTPEGHIKLDVMVNDAAGNAVTGLDPADFKLLDNNQPRRILSFRSYDGAAVKPNPPVQVILVFDTANLPFSQVAFTRQEVTKFLTRNGGRLAQPTSIFVFSEDGLRVQPRPSLDGTALTAELGQVKGNIRTLNPAMGAGGDLERFQRSVRQMATIAENFASRPGRKLLIWIGPGWPMLDPANMEFTDRDQQRYFDAIVELSTRLREARMVLSSVSPGSSTMDAGLHALLYQDFLKPVKAPRQADTGNLALKVLVTQTGGRILGPDNDLASQIEACVADANAFYTLSFDPPHADHVDEYHDLKVVVDKPGLTVRTNTGYYNQP